MPLPDDPIHHTANEIFASVNLQLDQISMAGVEGLFHEAPFTVDAVKKVLTDTVRSDLITLLCQSTPIEALADSAPFAIILGLLETLLANTRDGGSYRELSRALVEASIAGDLKGIYDLVKDGQPDPVSPEKPEDQSVTKETRTRSRERVLSFLETIHQKDT